MIIEAGYETLHYGGVQAIYVTTAKTIQDRLVPYRFEAWGVAYGLVDVYDPGGPDLGCWRAQVDAFEDILSTISERVTELETTDVR